MHFRLAIPVLILALLSASTAIAGEPTTRPVRLFILSGQSNMVGLDPDASYTPAVVKAFPNEECIIVKHASSGQSIRKWYKGWKAPEGKKVTVGGIGTIYTQLMEKVADAMKGKPEPRSITFVWMQGEADTKFQWTADLYAESIQGLLEQLQTDLKRKDIDFVVGRISDYKDPESPREGTETVRATQVKFGSANAHRAWVDTDDLNGPGDTLHYPKAGYKTLGERFAQKSIDVIKAAK